MGIRGIAQILPIIKLILITLTAVHTHIIHNILFYMIPLEKLECVLPLLAPAQIREESAQHA